MFAVVKAEPMPTRMPAIGRIMTGVIKTFPSFWNWEKVNFFVIIYSSRFCQCSSGQ